MTLAVDISIRGRRWLSAVALTGILAVSGTCGWAANALTPETITLEPTFQCMGVEVTFTGDDNANARGTVQYRAIGDRNWLTGHPLVRVSGRKERKPSFFTSLFYLRENTEYEVQVMFEDADKVATQLPPRTARTRDSNLKTGGGNEYFADPAATVDGDGSRAKPFTTLAKALAVGGPGDVIHLAKGVYRLTAPVTCARSGEEQAWLHIKGDPGAVITDAASGISGVGRLTWERYQQDEKSRWIYKLPVKNAHRVMVRKVPGDVATGYFLWRYMKNDGSRRSYQGPHRGETLEDMVEDYCRMNETGAFVQEPDALYLVLPKGATDPATADVQISLGKDHEEVSSDNTLTFSGHHVLVESLTFELTASLQSDSKAHHLAFRRIAIYGNNGRRRFQTGAQGLVEDSTFVFNAGKEWAVAPPAKTTRGNRWDPWGRLKNGCNDTHCIEPMASTVLRHNLFSGFNNVIQYPAPDQNRNIEIHNNLVERAFDDCVEPDGPGVNWRVYDNLFRDFFNGISDAPVDTGPFFVVRNVFAGYMQAAFKVRNGAAGRTLYYHNATYPQPDLVLYSHSKAPPPVWPIPDPRATGYAFAPDPAGDTWMRTRNNILIGGTKAYTIRNAGKAFKAETMDFDYNVLASVSGTPAEKCGEAHSIEAMPQFKDVKAGDLRLADSGQPGIDAGEIIKGINDEVPAPYQYKGKAPDMGVCEMGDQLPHYGPRVTVQTDKPDTLRERAMATDL